MHQEELRAELFFVHRLYTYKKDIITISRDTLQFFKDTETIESDNLKLNYVNSSIPRLGILISKRFIPLAVSRNSVRRAMREIYRNMDHKVYCYCILVGVTSKILAEKKAINDILLPEWKSLLDQLH